MPALLHRDSFVAVFSVVCLQSLAILGGCGDDTGSVSNPCTGFVPSVCDCADRRHGLMRCVDDGAVACDCSEAACGAAHETVCDQSHALLQMDGCGNVASGWPTLCMCECDADVTACNRYDDPLAHLDPLCAYRNECLAVESTCVEDNSVFYIRVTWRNVCDEPVAYVWRGHLATILSDGTSASYVVRQSCLDGRGLQEDGSLHGLGPYATTAQQFIAEEGPYISVETCEYVRLNGFYLEENWQAIAATEPANCLPDGCDHIGLACEQ